MLTSLDVALVLLAAPELGKDLEALVRAHCEHVRETLGRHMARINDEARNLGVLPADVLFLNRGDEGRSTVDQTAPTASQPPRGGLLRCAGARCPGLGWSPSSGVPHPRSCLSDVRSWPGAARVPGDDLAAMVRTAVEALANAGHTAQEVCSLLVAVQALADDGRPR